MNSQKLAIFSVVSLLGALMPMLTNAEQLISQQSTIQYVPSPDSGPNVIQPTESSTVRKPAIKGLPLRLRPFNGMNGAVVKPQETAIYSDRVKVLPDGTNVYPNGANVWFNLTTVYPDGTAVWADGTTIHPDGSATAFDGSPVNIKQPVIAPN